MPPLKGGCYVISRCWDPPQRRRAPEGPRGRGAEEPRGRGAEGPRGRGAEGPCGIPAPPRPSLLSADAGPKVPTGAGTCDRLNIKAALKGRLMRGGIYTFLVVFSCFGLFLVVLRGIF